MDYKRISDANEITARYMDSILIKQRLIAYSGQTA